MGRTVKSPVLVRHGHPSGYASGQLSVCTIRMRRWMEPGLFVSSQQIDSFEMSRTGQDFRSESRTDPLRETR